ncbi:hypothetical protein, partial [Salmonella enterica]|uniref:hypothetical protein n=1 Tax=Salmonella enterica TaxID=28901 RepID=UPI0015C4DFD5
MSLAKASLWTAVSTLVKIVAGLLVVKLLAVSFGPAGVGQARSDCQTTRPNVGLALS